MNISDIGFDEWFAAHAVACGLEGCGFARISAVDRGAYRIHTADREIPAELAGKLSHQIVRTQDLPCVGDWVTVHTYNDGAAALIHNVFPRRSFLRRKAPGETHACQMIAANIDTAFLVQSCHYDFNPRRLDRYLVMAADGHVEPVILLTKTDLISPKDLDHALAILRAVTTARVIALSSVSGTGFEALQQTLAPGKTYCLLGSSGVGKTTLINRLMGHEAFAARAVSGTGEGTHTTTRRQLVVLGQGAMLIDTPGMRELGVAGADDGVATGFEDIARLAETCRYADCSHGHEPGCAVRAAIEEGVLDAARYAHYLKLKKESAFYAMSAFEKRKKDKSFGRLVKSVKKRMKN